MPVTLVTVTLVTVTLVTLTLLSTLADHEHMISFNLATTMCGEGGDRMRCLDSIIESMDMSLSKPREIVRDLATAQQQACEVDLSITSPLLSLTH